MTGTARATGRDGRSDAAGGSGRGWRHARSATEKFAMSTSEPSCLYSGNAAFVEDLYESYLRDPDSVTSDWRSYFDTFGAPTAAPERAHGPV
ncbi:MAG: hypothetical protein K8E66_00485, partial [Phycisphaerales bacterium]|nr:hypothetical protein [Phycisphaerales bacterium]